MLKSFEIFSNFDSVTLTSTANLLSSFRTGAQILRVTGLPSEFVEIIVGEREDGSIALTVETSA